MLFAAHNYKSSNKFDSDEDANKMLIYNYVNLCSLGRREGTLSNPIVSPSNSPT